jgi:thymidylate synthase
MKNQKTLSQLLEERKKKKDEEQTSSFEVSKPQEEFDLSNFQFDTTDTKLQEAKPKTTML